MPLVTCRGYRIIDNSVIIFPEEIEVSEMDTPAFFVMIHFIFVLILQTLKDSTLVDKSEWTCWSNEVAAKGWALFLAINVNHCVAKSNFDDVYLALSQT